MSARRHRLRALLLAGACALTLGVIFMTVQGLRSGRTPAQPTPLTLDDLGAGRLTPDSFSHRNEDGGRVYDSPIGPIEFREGSGAGVPVASHKDLERAVAAVLALPSTEVPATGSWVWRALPWVGGVLTQVEGAYAVVDGVVLRAEQAADTDRPSDAREIDADVPEIVQATESFLTEAARDDDMTPWMHGALADLLRRLDDEPGNPALGEIDSDFARRVVAHPGWLEAMAPRVPRALCLAVQAPLRRSLRVRAVAEFTSDGVYLGRLGNAWGKRGLLLRTPERCVLVQAPPAPMDAGDRTEALASCRIVCEFPPEADPLATSEAWDDLRRASFARGGIVLAEWSPDDGFTADDAAWRAVFPVSAGSAVRGGWPPHVPLRRPDGVLRGVALPGGVLRAAVDHSAGEVERFLADAARLLPDAPHLDLIQQYFMRYTSDSPAPDRPLMVGCEAHSGDLHQTAAQTLASCVGGVCRGDCDDVAELLQVIAVRQGKLAYVIQLPGHLAAAWAERRGDLWHVFVLQSGPSHEFRHAELPSALEAAYLHLDPDAPFDRNGVGVSFRFNNQNTRGDFALSWRIFHDREYATLMIDVQADWNRMTLLRAEQKMLAVIAAGDAGSAENSELAGLCRNMARYADAAVYERTVLEQTQDPESRLMVLAELIDDLSDAGDALEASSWLTRLLDHEMPASSATLGLRTLVSGVDLAVDLAHRSPVLAARLLAAMARLELEELGEPLAHLLAAEANPDAWRGHGKNDTLQSLMVSYAAATLEVLDQIPPTARDSEDMQAIVSVVDVWLREHAFDDVDSPESVPYRWALRAWRLSPRIVDRLQRTEEADALEVESELDLVALGRAATDDVIWSWTRASPTFFSVELAAYVAHDAPTPDPAVVRRLGLGMEEAVRSARRLGIYGQGAEASQRNAALRVSLITQDETDLRRILREVRVLDDRDTHDDISSSIGALACHLPAPWWHTVIGCWLEEVDRPAYAFNIVWAAVGSGAPARALEAAERVAQHEPDERALQEEARLLRDYLANK